jgi:hypothetical protein
MVLIVPFVFRFSCFEVSMKGLVFGLVVLVAGMFCGARDAEAQCQVGNRAAASVSSSADLQTLSVLSALANAQRAAPAASATASVGSSVPPPRVSLSQLQAQLSALQAAQPQALATSNVSASSSSRARSVNRVPLLRQTSRSRSVAITRGG